MANLGSKGILQHIDDPSVAVLADATAAGVTWVVESTGSAVNFAKAVAAGKGLHYVATTTATNNEYTEFCSNDLLFAAQEGHCMVECMLQLDAITTVAFSFGFNDEVEDSGTTLPVELSGTTWTSGATAFCGFAFDTNADNDELHCFWVNGGVDTATAIADLRMKGMKPTAAKWLYMRVEMQDRGSGYGARATFLAVDHTGKSVEKVFNTTIARTTPLCFHLGVENRTTAIRNAYLKCPNWEQTIADM